MIPILYVVSLTVAAMVGYIITQIVVPLRKPMDIDYFDERYLFSKYPEGAFSAPPPYTISPQKFLFWASLFLVLPMFWILVNMPDLSNVTLIYLLMIAVFLAPALLEYMFPLKMEASGILGWGGKSYDVQAAVGGMIAVVTLLMFWTAPQQLSFMPMQMIDIGKTLAAFYLTVIAIPWVEEFVFGNFLASSFIEELGIIPGALIISAVFALFHFLVYASNIYLLITAFIFRFLTSLALVRFTSFLPGYIAHTIVNFVGFFFG